VAAKLKLDLLRQKQLLMKEQIDQQKVKPVTLFVVSTVFTLVLGIQNRFIKHGRVMNHSQMLFITLSEPKSRFVCH